MSIKGVVAKGKQRGKQLGFPTANIPVQPDTEEGIYISRTKINELWLDSITFVGKAKTFGETSFRAESYILDFDQDLYGKEIEIKLIKKIRDNQKFDSADKLIQQMKKDKKQALEYFKNP